MPMRFTGGMLEEHVQVSGVRYAKLKNMRRTRFYRAIVLGVALFFVRNGSAQEIKKLQKLRIGVPSRSMSSFPHIVALRQGFYQQSGFEVELIVVSSGIPAVQAVVAGDLDFTTTGNVATLAALRGMPIRNVMVSSIATDQSLVVRPDTENRPTICIHGKLRRGTKLPCPNDRTPQSNNRPVMPLPVICAGCLRAMT